MCGLLLQIVFDPDFTSGILADEAVWKKYAQNLIQYAYIYGFDGDRKSVV